MLLNQIKYGSHTVVLYLFAILYVLFPTPETAAAGISFSGISEASLVALSGGMSQTNLSLTATPASPAGTTNMVFLIERQGSNFRQFTSAPPYSVILSNLPAGKYFLSATLLSPGVPPSGDLSFDITIASLQPFNDNWASAAPVSSPNATFASSNTYATAEPGEPTHGGVGVGKSIWGSWSAMSNGVFTATTAGSSFDTVLAVYQGTNLSTLTEIGANDDAGPHSFSQVTFSATNGTIYYFAVDSASTTSGNAQLRLVAGSPPLISITSPPDGVLFLVASPSVATNTQAIASISDPAGVARVDYWFDGGVGVSRSGMLSPPYQLNLTNLFAGHYVLTYAASNNLGLVSLKSIGLSVISLAPVLVMDGFVASSGKFQLGITGFKGPNYALLASSNLDVWCSIKTWTNFPGAEKVADTNAAQFARRFYRAASTQ
jgi:hypothetical protein